MFIELQNRLNPARHRRHADTHRYSGPPPCHSRALIRRNLLWRMTGECTRCCHYKSTSRSARGSGEGVCGDGWMDGWRVRGERGESACSRGAGRGGSRGEIGSCSGVFHLVLAGSHAGRHLLKAALDSPAPVRSVCARARVCCETSVRALYCSAAPGKKAVIVAQKTTEATKY